MGGEKCTVRQEEKKAHIPLLGEPPLLMGPPPLRERPLLGEAPTLLEPQLHRGGQRPDSRRRTAPIHHQGSLSLLRKTPPLR